MTFGSLFSGAGGFDMGFHQAGFECLWTAEIDKDASDVLAKLGSPNLGDVTKIDGSKIAVPDVVIWGSPCQDLSVANSKRLGLAGEKSGLFYDGIRIIDSLRRRGLRFSIWENVAGAIHSNDGKDFLAVVSAFEQLGAAEIAWRVLDGRYFGVPQKRRRVFVVADFGGECAGEILCDASAGAVCAETGGIDGMEPGAGSQVGTVTPRNPARSTRPDCMILHPTLQTRSDVAGRDHVWLTEGFRLRWRTPLESERLMGWSDDWTKLGASGKEMSDSARYRMTGNGVITPVAKWLADNLARVIADERLAS